MSDTSADIFPEFPPYSIIDVGFVESSASLVIRCSGICIVLEVQLSMLQDTTGNTSSFENDFIKFRDNFDDAEMVDAFEEWAIEPCLPLLRQLTSFNKDKTSFTLQDYFDPPMLQFGLLNFRGRLEVFVLSSDVFLENPSLPTTTILDLHEYGIAVEDIPLYNASELQIVAGKRADDIIFNAIPKAVKTSSTNLKMAFKAVQDSNSFARELNIMLQIGRNTDDTDVRLPKLVGLVKGAQSGTFIGVLTQYIDHEMDLEEAALSALQPTRERWMRQIESTVRRLHQLNLVWGDVKPQNVLIDKDNNAWIIDFGGGYSPHWVDEGLQETTEGDMSGISKFREFLSL